MPIRSPYLTSLLATLFILASSLVQAGPELSTNAEGQALQGYDVVAYFNEGKPTQGNAQFSTTHGDATYQFVSAENLEAFISDPERYLPQYGGYCAFGTSLGKKFDGDPMSWKIVDGKLYINSGEKAHSLWLKDVPGKIQQADTNWPEIKSKTAAELN